MVLKSAYKILGSRYELIRLAQAEDIRAPETAIVNSSEKLRGWFHKFGLPAYLKVDGSLSGAGVRHVTSLTDAIRTFELLRKPRISLRNAIKAALKDQDVYTWMHRFNGRTPLPNVNVQSSIDGTPANCVFSCWQGEVLGLVGVEVLQTASEHGVATVARVVDEPVMMNAATRIARRLKLSGIFGIDFVIEKKTDLLWLIEMNFRPTPTAHLHFGLGRDPCGALLARMLGQPEKRSNPITDNKLISIFPHQFNPQLCTNVPLDAFHDIPWDEPELIRRCMPISRHTGDVIGEFISRRLL